MSLEFYAAWGAAVSLSDLEQRYRHFRVRAERATGAPDLIMLTIRHDNSRDAVDVATRLSTPEEVLESGIFPAASVTKLASGEADSLDALYFNPEHSDAPPTNHIGEDGTESPIEL